MLIPLAIVLAQACYLESDYRVDECAAIAHVLVRRAHGGDVAKMAHAYSLDKHTPRARRARHLPRGLPARELPRWLELVATAQGVLDGTVANPCPRAMHWGSRTLPTDVARAERALGQGRWRVVRCTRGMANAFYALTSKRVLRRRGP